MIKIFLIIFFMTLFLVKFSFTLFQLVYVYIYIYILCSGFCVFIRRISYSYGLDRFSYGLILMSLLISSLIIISIITSKNLSIFLIISSSLTFFLLVIFSSLNFLYIYISFEFILFPLLILILGWGYQPERLMAGLYLFFYTVLVSLPLLILIIHIYIGFGSLFFDCLQFNSDYFLIHFILIMVFIVRMPIYIVHFWLPRAHVQAPVSGSIVLAGLILRIGGYGLIRTMSIYEYIYLSYSRYWFSFCIIGSLTISLVCLIQADMRCLIAYSSISHMGIVIIGLLTSRTWGLIGSYFLMLGHGFCSSGLFYMANLFYTRTISRRFYINKGIFIFIPSCTILWFLLCRFNISCPPRLNFVGELIILSRILSFWSKSFFFFIFISFFCACFSYYLYSYRQHGLYHTLYRFSIVYIVEYLCVFIHLIPLIFFSIVLITFYYLSSLIKI